jgi:hypothetical protein
MPYILNKTNGSVLTTVNDASTDLTTNLTFVGRNYSGYGEIVNENFVKLLENFSNTSANFPSKPLQGQLWFNSTTRQLTVSYDGKSFKGLASLRISTDVNRESVNNFVQGDLWWDSTNSQLSAFDGSSFVLVGPATSAAVNAAWTGVNEPKDETNRYTILKAKIGTNPVVTISSYGGTDFIPTTTSDLYSKFKIIKKGITLAGADAITGSSYNPQTQQGYVFWGTAAEALVAVSATTAVSTTGITAQNSTDNIAFNVPFISNNGTIYKNAGITFNPSTGVLNTIASQARYADLAERYAADMPYEVGTVVVIGGAKEVTACEERASTAVAGIVSKNPAYMMNSDAGTDETHPYIALKGRVPCKIIGSIKKGDLLVTSARLGHACAKLPTDSSNAVIGKALEDFQGPVGVIEVLVV